MMIRLLGVLAFLFLRSSAFKPSLSLRGPVSTLRVAPMQLKLFESDTHKEDVSGLKARVERLAQYESEYLLPFWSDEKKCFQITAESSAARVSVTSTCALVDLILKNRQHWKKHVSWKGSEVGGSDVISLEAITA